MNNEQAEQDAMQFFKWAANSRKVMTGLSTILTVLLTHLLSHLGFSASDIATVNMCVLGIGSAIILGIAHEDNGEAIAGKSETRNSNDESNPNDQSSNLTGGAASTGATVMKSLLLLCALSLAFLCVGCKSGASVDALYISADRATYNAATPLLTKESTDHPEDAAAVSNLTSSWNARVAAAEATVPGSAVTTQPAK